MKWFKSMIQRLYFKQEKNLALFDLETLTYNRNWWEHIGIQKYKHKACYITMIDINGLKEINDTKGHIEGDRIIQSTSVTLQSHFPNQDLIRIGGDEFVLITEYNPQRLLRIAFEQTKSAFSYGYKLKYAADDLGITIFNADYDMRKMKQSLKKK